MACGGGHGLHRASCVFSIPCRICIAGIRNCSPCCPHPLACAHDRYWYLCWRWSRWGDPWTSPMPWTRPCYRPCVTIELGVEVGVLSRTVPSNPWLTEPLLVSSPLSGPDPTGRTSHGDVPSNSRFRKGIPEQHHQLARRGGAMDVPEAPSIEREGGEKHRVCASEELPDGGRSHVRVGGRFVSVLRVNGKLHALDSVCFHAGGPLALGDLEDVDGRTCLSCPWHHYKVTLDTGEKLYKALEKIGDQLVPGDWRSVGKRQRIHPVKEEDGVVYVWLDLRGELASDQSACDPVCGQSFAKDNLADAPLGAECQWKAPG
eukprot:scaffold840_cov344-Pavlova_lutheri.AAC.118